jgi:hypothetical protein
MNTRVPTPDEKLNWKNWNDVVRQAEEYYQKAIAAEEKHRKWYLQQAMNLLEGVPDTHPDKARLVKYVKSLLY